MQSCHLQAMASTPGHPFWERVIDKMIERAPITNIGWNMDVLPEGDWKSSLVWRTGRGISQQSTQKSACLFGQVDIYGMSISSGRTTVCIGTLRKPVCAVIGALHLTCCSLGMLSPRISWQGIIDQFSDSEAFQAYRPLVLDRTDPLSQVLSSVKGRPQSMCFVACAGQDLLATSHLLSKLP